jgi:hypothetical protein
MGGDPWMEKIPGRIALGNSKRILISGKGIDGGKSLSLLRASYNSLKQLLGGSKNEHNTENGDTDYHADYRETTQ